MFKVPAQQRLCRYMGQQAQDVASRVHAPVGEALASCGASAEALDTDGSQAGISDAGVTALHAAVQASSCTTCSMPQMHCLP